MPTFGNRKYRPASYSSSLPARYRAALARHPFALFGLPFIATMVLGSFFLTPATALRYERHDRKVRQLSKEEELGIGKDKRKIDLREEYYLGLFRGLEWPWQWGNEANKTVQKLAAKDLDNWEQKRIKRLPGEPDGVLE